MFEHSSKRGGWSSCVGLIKVVICGGLVTVKRDGVPVTWWSLVTHNGVRCVVVSLCLHMMVSQMCGDTMRCGLTLVIPGVIWHSDAPF